MQITAMSTLDGTCSSVGYALKPIISLSLGLIGLFIGLIPLIFILIFDSTNLINPQISLIIGLIGILMQSRKSIHSTNWKVKDSP